MTNLQENLTALSADLAIFERKIQHLAKEMTIDLSHYEIDHLALRVNSEQSAKNWLILLLKCGRILSDNIVNGRKIYLIELEKPVKFANQFVDIIELPLPKCSRPRILRNITVKSEKSEILAISHFKRLKIAKFEK